MCKKMGRIQTRQGEEIGAGVRRKEREREVNALLMYVLSGYHTREFPFFFI